MQVLIIGQNTGWNLEASYARGFESVGHKVSFWNPIEALHRKARGFRIGELFSSFVNVEPWLRKANLELIELAGKLQPDFILVIGTEGVRAGTLGQLRAQFPNILIYCLFPDTPHNLIPDRIQSLPLFDRVITVSPAWMDTFERLGARSVMYLPLAADPTLHNATSNHGLPARSESDVAFIGNWRPEREAFLEQLLDFDLAIWGSHYWKRRTRKGSEVALRWKGRALFGQDFARACLSNRILLNLIDGVGWPGPNMRAFELAACRAFSLVTRTPPLLELFQEGVNIECFGSVEELRDKIKFYLKNDTAREQIAKESHEFVVHGGHTYFDRARQIVEWVSEDRGHGNKRFSSGLFLQQSR